jgi:chromosome condensin MukBEF ATPase and DNA-binding subunit MukB
VVTKEQQKLMKEAEAEAAEATKEVEEVQAQIYELQAKLDAGLTRARRAQDRADAVRVRHFGCNLARVVEKEGSLTR